MSYRPQYTKNLKRGEEGANVYWRVLWALEDDAIASMLAKHTLEGLAAAYQKGMTNPSGITSNFSVSGAKHWAREVIRISPLSILSDKAIEHLGAVIESAIFPEGFPER